MHFLSPGAGLLAAAIAGPLLLILYLLRLRRRPARVSTILFWPAASQDVQANEPLRWVRPSWLLALHALILALVAGAIARPVWRGSGAAARIVLIVDASASMSAPDEPGGPTRLERARQAARRIADETFRSGSGRQIAVLAFAAQASLVGSFTSSRAAVEQAIDSIMPTDQPGNLPAALRLAQACAAQGDEREGASAPEGVLISDGSFAAAEPPTPGLRVRFERVGPPPGSPPPGSAGIVAFAARRDDRDPTIVRAFADLLSTHGTARPLALNLSLNGSPADQRVVTMPAAPPSGEAVRRVVTFELPGAAEGVLLLTIDGSDSLAADDSAALVLPPPQRRTFMLVSPESSRSTPGGWLLSDALAELRPRDLVTLTPDEFSRKTTAELSTVDLVVFDRAQPASLPPCPTLSFGVAPPLGGLAMSPERVPLPEGAPLFWMRSHPVLRNTTLDSLVVTNVSPMEWRPQPDATAEELITGPTGPMLLLVEARGFRHLITNFDLDRSNWPLLASFPIFLSDAADFLSLRGERTTGKAFRTAEAVSVRVRPGRGETTLVGTRGPVAVAEGIAEEGELSLGTIPHAGVYLVEGPRAIDRAVAVNLTDETESSLAAPTEVRMGRVAVSGVAPGHSPTEVWPFLIAALAGLMMLEWVVYARQVRA